MERYNHQEIEKKWQQNWKEQNLYTVEDHVEGKENYYQLVEFPYPSGNLHVGHWYAFCGPDIHARYIRMTGKNVLFPIGFDAFGLPAENAAIKRGLNPADWTEDNMASMERQIDSMGASFDRTRMVATCRPEYYKHTQWLFNQLFAAGLVERKTTQANWCPSCKTVLANEQVVGGACERCDSVVVKKEMPQWQVKITKYADRLIDDLDALDWPEEIKAAQKNWIGRSEGAEIEFAVANRDEKITVFTTRPDTLFGATYMVLAPEHALVQQLLSECHSREGGNPEPLGNPDEVAQYVEKAKKKSDIERQAEGKEKTGVKLDGISAINPANGAEIPVYIADYVLAHYGTGAIMAVPAHDERDWDFAERFGIKITHVIERQAGLKNLFAYIHPSFVHGIKEGESQEDAEERSEKDLIEKIDSGLVCYTGPGLVMGSAQFDGMTSEEAKKAITEHVGGRLTKTYKLRDWGVSRQRYWGCPIPLVHCGACGWQPVPDEQLPVELPAVENYLPNDDGRSPLAKNEEFVHTTCPQCGGAAERETDTMDTFVDSSWYFLRYTDAQNAERFASKEKLENWMPVDFYNGGAEHTTMHVLYSRFFHKALFDLGLVNSMEPYTRRTNHGLILGPDGKKMSKSKGNVIDPDDIVKKLGADTLRLYLAFIGPYNEVGSYPWNPQSIIGVRRFVERVWNLQSRHSHENGNPEHVLSGETTKKIDPRLHEDDTKETSFDVDKSLHKALKLITQSIAEFKLNTGVAALMTALNEIEKKQLTKEQLALFATILAPYAPHIAEELWQTAGGIGSVHQEPWPTLNESLLVEDQITIAVQVNGKVRAEITVPVDMDEESIKSAALSNDRVQTFTEGKEPKRVIYVKGRLVNIVV